MKEIMTKLVVAIAIAVGMGGIGRANAQAYPSRPITMVVTFPAGGPVDGVARTLANDMGERLGQRIAIENKGGAGGTIGAAGVAKSPSDGYTLLFTSSGPLSYYRTVHKSLGYDPSKDLAPIAVIGTIAQVIIASPTLPATTLQELIGYAKAHPGKLNIGDSGIGTTVHILAALFARETGIEVAHVHYRGAANSLADVMSGQIDAAFSAFLPQFESMKALGITSTARLEALPKVPTFRESGVDIVSGLSMSLAAPAGTPPAVIAKLNAAVNEFRNSPRGEEIGAALGLQMLGGTPADMGAFLEQEAARLEPVIRAAKITMD
jgi:tripartite-type tricarboxylate transporter receptor subunit TctC